MHSSISNLKGLAESQPGIVFGYMEATRQAKKMNSIDKKYVSKVLVELAEENLRCPENRQYVSMRGVIKVKSKVQTQ